MATASSTATVADAALTATGTTIAATEGAGFSGTVASFTDADPNGTSSDYSDTIDWGDGTTTSGKIIANGTGGFDVVGSQTYAEEGTYTLGVAITDVGGSSTTASSTATVADASLSASGTAFAATEGASFTGTVASFTDADPNGTVTDYTASIDWGDGTTSSGTV